jgi:hypothetical protein
MAKILGVDTDKVSEAVVDKYLTEFGMTATGRINRKIRILAKHFADRKQKEGDAFEEVVCTTCGGDSPATLPECPFCGDSDEVVNTPPVVGKPVAEDEPEDAPEAQSDDEPEQEPEPVPDDEPEEKPAPKKRSKAKEVAQVSERASKLIAKPEKAKPKKRSKAVSEPPPGDDDVEPSTEIAVPDAVFSEADLDESVAEAKKYMASATLEAYRLGKVLKYIHDNNLYLLRKGEKGPAHLSFKSFVRAEFEISHQQAYNLMAVVEHFTEEEVNRIGVSKLKLALQLPRDMRDDILSGAEDGATMSQLSERASKLLDKPEKPRKAVRDDGGITAILAMGILEAPMYCAPHKPGKVGAPTKPARTLKDLPFCVFQLENDVIATVRIELNDEGELVASLAFRKSVE